MVWKVFAGPGPHPTFIFPTIPQLSASTVEPFPAMITNNSTFSNPFLDPRHTFPLKPISPPYIQDPNLQPTYISPPSRLNNHSPCQLDITSLASPPTPAGMISRLGSHSPYQLDTTSLALSPFFSFSFFLSNLLCC